MLTGHILGLIQKCVDPFVPIDLAVEVVTRHDLQICDAVTLRKGPSLVQRSAKSDRGSRKKERDEHVQYVALSASSGGGHMTR